MGSLPENGIPVSSSLVYGRSLIEARDFIQNISRVCMVHVR